MKRAANKFGASAVRVATISTTCVLLAVAWLGASRGTAAQTAPGGPGALPAWTTGAKDGLGTATTAKSKVWYTLAGGVMTEVYYPRLDVANVRTLEFAVSDGKRVWLEGKDMGHAIERGADDALVYRQTNSSRDKTFKIVKTYVTDPERDTVLIDVKFDAPTGYVLFVLFDPALKNLGVGDTGSTRDGALVTEKDGAACALMASAGFEHPSSGFAAGSDGYTDLLLHKRLEWGYPRAENGNVVQ